MDIRRRVLFNLLGGDEDMKPIKTGSSQGDNTVSFSTPKTAFAIVTGVSSDYNDLHITNNVYLLAGTSVTMYFNDEDEAKISLSSNSLIIDTGYNNNFIYYYYVIFEV